MRRKDSYKIKIKKIAYDFIREYINEMGWHRPDEIVIDLRELFESVIYPKFEYQLITDVDLGFVDGQQILGKFVPKDKVILIDKSISPPNFDPRFAFSLGHEFGHGVLHSDSKVLFRCSEKQIFEDRQKEIKEIQANLFSENILMPDSIVRHRVEKCYQLRRPFIYTGPGYYNLFINGCDKRVIIGSYTQYCREIAKPLTTFFSNVSKQSLGLKIHKLGFINNLTKEEFGKDDRRCEKLFYDIIT